MQFFKQLIEDNKDDLVDYIFDDELRDKVITAINDNVDIPFISEKIEGKIISSL